MSRLSCLRCGAEMEGPVGEKFQLGEQGLFSNHWAHLMAGALEVNIYSCPRCGKLEFFAPRKEAEEKLPQKECPECGLSIDFDYAVCPCCGCRIEK